jgi:hypothetical protein
MSKKILSIKKCFKSIRFVSMSEQDPSDLAMPDPSVLDLEVIPDTRAFQT